MVTDANLFAGGAHLCVDRGHVRNHERVSGGKHSHSCFFNASNVASLQVAIGESTCASKLWAPPVGYGGHALLEVSELSQLALERGRSAREAIQIMGSLAEKYGFYSADWDVSTWGESRAMGEGGEALTVIDPAEAWMFHITPDDTGRSAVWVAQRVPDGHITAVANSFRIR
jgi:dipeptidase